MSAPNALTARREALAQFNCLHETTDLRRKQLRDERIQFVKQCVTCGEQTSTAIKREVVALEQDPDLIPQFDKSLRLGWQEKRKIAEQQAIGVHHETNLEDRQNFWDWYEQYLVSPEWQEKRKLVLQRAAGLCEGCRTSPAREVHHLTYRHAGNEFLFELAALCLPCHNRIHVEHTSLPENQRRYT
jgi:hypothetical protein